MKVLALIAAVLFITVTAWAGPAPWYKWHSREADYEVCAQFSPGDGWVKVKGPFEDSKCNKILRN
jgi:hypothetical protein